MSLDDRYGLTLSTDSPAARDAYVAGVDLLLAAQPGAGDAFDRALAEDPAFALAHAARARVLQLGNRLDEAREAVGRAAVLAAGTTERERAHVEIFTNLLNGRGPDALALTASHMARHPRDAVALSPCVGVFGLYGFSGRADRESALAALLDSVADEFADDWWFLCAHAFALIENGEAARGRDLVERSLEQVPRNANGAHIHAHALYELAADGTAAGFLDGWLPDYPADGPLHCHLWWHLALMRMFSGDAAGMWRAYEAYCAPGRSVSPPINVVTDGVSLLWRARLAGMDVERERWQALRRTLEAQFPAPGIFIDVHYGICLAALGDEAAVAAFVDRLRAALADGRLLAGPVAIRIVEAARAFVEGDMARVIDRLAPHLDEVVRIGGSRAQRDLVSNTLIAALLRTGDRTGAAAVLARRGPRAVSMPVAGLEPQRA